MPHLPIFEEWRTVQRSALEAELALYRAQLDHCADRAPAPHGDVVRSTRMLQAHAHRLFEAAMSEMQAAARALRFGSR